LLGCLEPRGDKLVRGRLAWEVLYDGDLKGLKAQAFVLFTVTEVAV